MNCRNPKCYDGKVPVNDGEALAPCPDCSKQKFLIVTGGDGYSTKIVDEDKLEEAYLAAIYGDAKHCPAHEREILIEHLRNDDYWQHAHGIGRVRFEERGCDGYLEIIRLVD